ncbi:MAG: hypothetical protein EXR29_03050 [Betaproteobacteria bacterium]|nr:hypothetical protein [Betaproteobacteria bacterium]
MRQAFLPGFPDGAVKIGSTPSILTHDRTVTYFVGCDNYLSHPQGDKKGQRFALANLMVNGHVRAVDLERSPLGIAHRTLMNWMAQFREAGAGSFYAEAPLQKPRVMTAGKVAMCSRLLTAGHRPADWWRSCAGT